MAIKWKWDGKTVQLSNEEPSTYEGQQATTPTDADTSLRDLTARAEDTFQKQMERLAPLERMEKASPAQKREWGYYFRHALRDAKKGQPVDDWILGLVNSGGLNIDEDGYTWWKGLSEKNANTMGEAIDRFANRIGVWYRDETGKEQFNPDALRSYQEDQNRRFIEEQRQ